MNANLKLLVKGDTPTLLDADKANEVIRAINAVRNLTVSPQGLGKVTLGEKNMQLDLTPLKTLYDQLAAVVSAISTTTSSGGGGGGGSDLTSIKNAYNALLTALGSSTITAECDATTRAVTVTWNIDLPGPI